MLDDTQPANVDYKRLAEEVVKAQKAEKQKEQLQGCGCVLLLIAIIVGGVYLYLGQQQTPTVQPVRRSRPVATATPPYCSVLSSSMREIENLLKESKCATANEKIETFLAWILTGLCIPDEASSTWANDLEYMVLRYC